MTFRENPRQLSADYFSYFLVDGTASGMVTLKLVSNSFAAGRVPVQALFSLASENDNC
jgi:hypothetical protein